MEKQQALFEYCLRMGDNSLILGHRLSEWCGHGPILEEDIAMTNISLDLIGQTRTLLSYAADIEGKGRTEDDLAFLRDEMDFRNFLIVEQTNGDFAKTILRQLFYTAFSYHFYDRLKNSKDSTLAAIAEKSIKEVTYHLRHCSEWVIRLGDGTEESHRRMNEAIEDLWMFTGDMFAMDGTDELLIKEGIGVDLNEVKKNWNDTIKEVFERATLKLPENNFMVIGSREGKHSEHLGLLLAEMQFLPRAYPGAQW